jgi:hypothetical protein
MTLRDINIVLKSHAAGLMALPGVHGVAVGETEDGTPCIMVLAEPAAGAIGGAIPETLDGHPVRILDSDEIRPMRGE